MMMKLAIGEDIALFIVILFEELGEPKNHLLITLNIL